jgi:hypothetical protein
MPVLGHNLWADPFSVILPVVLPDLHFDSLRLCDRLGGLINNAVNCLCAFSPDGPRPHCARIVDGTEP